ncbi:MAG TPA: lipocalin-like domain-containing protein [Acidobacteriaceae bacterium]|nr:lipocalin-like domain-containing protein [Acidobacteriaceae bacterium]
MRRVIACCVVMFFLAVPDAVPQGTNAQLARKIVGAWQLVSVEGQPPGLPGFYDHPTGLLIYDPSGTMSVQIANRGGRKTFARGLAAGTTAEKVAAFDGYFSYYGTYTVDDAAGTVTHHVEDSSYPDLRARHHVRWVEFQGDDRMVLIPCEDGNGGAVLRKGATYKLYWERVK